MQKPIYLNRLFVNRLILINLHVRIYLETTETITLNNEAQAAPFIPHNGIKIKFKTIFETATIAEISIMGYGVARYSGLWGMGLWGKLHEVFGWSHS